MYLVNDQLLFENTRKEYFKYHLSHDSIAKINIEEYCEILFGKYSYKLRNILDQAISITSDKIYSASYQEDHLSIHDLEGELIEVKSGIFHDLTPYSISVNDANNELWVASGGFQVVKCIDLLTSSQKLIIGEFHEETEEMSFPEHVFIFNNDTYVSEMGNRRVSKVNHSTHETSTYLEIQEPTWKFVKNQLGEFVLLDSGIYRVVENDFVKLK